MYLYLLKETYEGGASAELVCGLVSHLASKLQCIRSSSCSCVPDVQEAVLDGDIIPWQVHLWVHTVSKNLLHLSGIRHDSTQQLEGGFDIHCGECNAANRHSAAILRRWKKLVLTVYRDAFSKTASNPPSHLKSVTPINNNTIP